MKDTILGILGPVLLLVACCAGVTVALAIAMNGRDLNRVNVEDEQAHDAAARQAEANELLHGQTFAPVR